MEDLSKERFSCKVVNLADKLRVPRTLVYSIITSYLDYCRELIARGSVVQIYGLATIVPKDVVSDDVLTLAYQCKQLSKRMSFEYVTTLNVISEYLSSLKHNLYEGRNVDMKGILHLKPMLRPDGKVKVWGTSSVALKRYLREKCGEDYSVRIKTSTVLKSDLQNNYKGVDAG